MKSKNHSKYHPNPLTPQALYKNSGKKETGSYRQAWVKFKDFSRTSKSLSYSFQGLKDNEIFSSKCWNSTSAMLDWDNGDISTGKKLV